MSCPSPPPPRIRFTLGQVMLAVAIAALLCSVTARPGTTLGPQGVRVLRSLSVLVGSTLGLLVILMTARSLVETVFGISCPNCLQADLARVAMRCFSYRYYRCAGCGWRCKRRPLMTWEDASGPEDDVHYQHKAVAGPPGLVPGRDEDEAFWQGTTGSLLRSQRGRRTALGDPPDPQAEPGPEPDQVGSS